MSTSPAPGDVIQRYKIVRLIAHGGVASTYEVEDTRNSERFAMKRLSLALLRDWKEYELFEREARVLASLRHPSIPRYVEHFQLERPAGEHAYYLVQQLAPGASLAQRVASGWRSDEIGARRIATQLLGILRDLQSLAPPVFHRDVKPQNVLLADDGRIFLVDFGAVQDAYRSLTGGSTVVGTYGYMAPEQLRGVAVPATDVYGVASTILFLLTGVAPSELPQRGLRPDFRAHVRCSTALAKWLDGALEPDPEERFRDARAALDALRGLAPVGARGSRARAAVLAGTLVALLAAAVAAFTFSARRASPAKPTVSVGDRPAPPQLPPRPPSDRFELVYPAARTLDAHRGGAFALAVSPDGATIASGGADGPLKLWSAKTGEPEATLGGYTGRIYSASFSADAALLLSAGGKRVDVWDAKARKPVFSTEADPKEVGRAALSGDGRLVATSGTSDRAVRLWDAATGRSLRALSPVPGASAIAMAFSPDGKILAAAGEEPLIRLWSTETGALVASCAGHSGTVDELAFSPDGETLYSTSDDRTLRAWSADCRPLVTLGDHGGEAWCLAVSPRGDLVATGTKDGWIKLWDTARLALRFQIEDGSGGTTRLAFFPDGSTLAAAGLDGRVRIWKLPAHTRARLPESPVVLDPPAVGSSPTPAEAYARAIALIDGANGRNFLDEAERLARGALAKDARFAPAYCALARIALRRGYIGGKDYQPSALVEAGKLVDRAAAIAPDLAAVHLARAWMLHARGDYKGGLREANEAEASGPTPAADIVLALESTKSYLTYADAERYAVRALAAKPTRGQAWWAYSALEDVYRDDGDYEAAKDAFRAQINLDPDSVWAKGNYAAFLIGIGDYAGAYEAAQRALAQKDYGMGRAQLSRAQSEGGILLLWDYGRAEDARKQFEGAIAADPSNATAHYGLAAYWRQVAIAHKDAKALANADAELEKSTAAGNAEAKELTSELPRIAEWIASNP